MSDDTPRGSVFDWITPSIGLLSRLFGRRDLFDDLPAGMSGNDVFRVLARAGCGPVRGSLCADPDRGTFVVAVRDLRRARRVLADLHQGRGDG